MDRLAERSAGWPNICSGRRGARCISRSYATIRPVAKPSFVDGAVRMSRDGLIITHTSATVMFGRTTTTRGSGRHCKSVVACLNNVTSNRPKRLDSNVISKRIPSSTLLSYNVHHVGETSSPIWLVYKTHVLRPGRTIILSPDKTP